MAPEQVNSCGNSAEAAEECTGHEEKSGVGSGGSQESGSNRESLHRYTGRKWGGYGLASTKLVFQLNTGVNFRKDGLTLFHPNVTLPMFRYSQELAT